jgi:hypothetical protein
MTPYGFAKITSESVLYDVRLFTPLLASTLASPLDKSPVYLGLGPLHTRIIRSL